MCDSGDRPSTMSAEWECRKGTETNLYAESSRTLYLATQHAIEAFPRQHTFVFLRTRVWSTEQHACGFSGKPTGLRTARKLRNTRRINNWADKAYKRSHLGKEWVKPFAGCSHAKGIVLEKM